MVAGCGSAWHRHPHLTQWAAHSNLKIGSGNAIFIVSQLVLDQLPCELRLTLPLARQSLQQLLTGKFLHQPNANHPTLSIVGRPLHIDCVCQDWRKLAQWGDVDWPGRPLWLHIWFVGWDWVWQWAHLAIDLDTDRGRELVPLLGGGVERTEPELDLVQIVQLAPHPYVSVACN